MAFNEQELNIIKFAKENGKTREETEKALYNFRNGIIPTPTKTSDSIVSDIKQTGSALKKTFQDTQIAQSQALEAGVRGEQGLGRSFAQAVGIGAGGVSKAIGDVLVGGVKVALPQGGEDVLKSTAKEIVSPVMQSDPVQAVVQKYNALDEKTKRDVDALLGVGSLALDFGGGAVAKEAATGLTKKVVKIGNEAIDNISTVVKGGRTFVGNGDAIKRTLMDFVAPEADDITKTILKESKPQDIDKYVAIQEQATKDPRAITPYEAIGDNMAEATKDIQKKLQEVGKQKSAIVAEKASEPFEATSVIDDLTALRNTKSEILQPSDIDFLDKVIAEAKTIKTKGQADKFIDDVQDAIYTGNRTQTIPTGSALDRQTQRILGKYNSELKKALPEVYTVLNAKYAETKGVLESLNAALGEVVDGVSTRGGSLVKQFFSPNGRKAKELFDFIKKETGIDLAKDATLARYVMELFDDPRARTLLGGNIPTSVSGVVDKVVDLFVEKTGVGKTIQKAQREGAIQKAKRLTQ